MNILYFVLLISVFNNNRSDNEFCRVIEKLMSEESLFLSEQNSDSLVGNINLVILFTRDIEDEYNIGIGKYKCNDKRIIIFSEKELFSSSFDKCIKIEKIKRKRDKVLVKYRTLKYRYDLVTYPFETISTGKLIIMD